MNITSNGRQPKNIKSGISMQSDLPQIINLILGDKTQIKHFLKSRPSPIGL